MAHTVPQGPQRIVCLTEETTEWLYLLGQESRIVGVSGYTVRPRRARDEKPRVSAFLDGKIDKIVALEPDLVIGFSDMQAALADKLIRAGLNVLVTNQRSVAEILATLRLVAGLVGEHARAEAWIADWQRGADAIAAAGAAWPRRPRVYFEEWDEPMISAIQWVSELIGIAGGDDVFPELAVQRLGRDVAQLLGQALQVGHDVGKDAVDRAAAGRGVCAVEVIDNRVGGSTGDASDCVALASRHEQVEAAILLPALAAGGRLRVAGVDVAAVVAEVAEIELGQLLLVLGPIALILAALLLVHRDKHLMPPCFGHHQADIFGVLKVSKSKNDVTEFIKDHKANHRRSTLDRAVRLQNGPNL